MTEGSVISWRVRNAVTTAQAATLTELVHCYLDRMPAEIADGYKRRLEGEGLEDSVFDLCGPQAPPERQQRFQPRSGVA